MSVAVAKKEIKTKSVGKSEHTKIFKMKTDMSVLRPSFSGIITNIINVQKVVESGNYTTVFEFKDADFAVRLKMAKGMPLMEVSGTVGKKIVQFRRRGQSYELLAGTHEDVIEMFRSMNKVLAVKKYNGSNEKDVEEDVIANLE